MVGFADLLEYETGRARDAVVGRIKEITAEMAAKGLLNSGPHMKAILRCVSESSDAVSNRLFDLADEESTPTEARRLTADCLRSFHAELGRVMDQQLDKIFGKAEQKNAAARKAIREQWEKHRQNLENYLMLRESGWYQSKPKGPTVNNIINNSGTLKGSIAQAGTNAEVRHTGREPSIFSKILGWIVGWVRRRLTM